MPPDGPWLPELGPALAAVRIGAAGAVPELDQLGPRAVPAKRASFAAGRVAARRVLERAWGALPEGLRVAPDPRGKPIAFVDGAPSATELSISHAGGLAVAAAALSPLGVDLVELEALPRALTEEAFAEGELAGFVGALGERTGACVAFGAKEAALKWLGVGMGVPLAAVSVRPEVAASGGFPWTTAARVEHPRGRAALTLSAWPIEPELICVLLFS